MKRFLLSSAIVPSAAVSLFAGGHSVGLTIVGIVVVRSPTLLVFRHV